jgi:transposase-like protein
MPKTRLPYAPEFRRQMIELVRAGRDPDDLSREFEPTSQSIRNWVAQADRSEGRREEQVEATSSAERDELIKLRREVRQLKLERDILSNQRGLRSACGVETGSIYSPGRR